MFSISVAAMMRDFIRSGRVGKHYGASVIFRSGSD
jgi:hypothetical protein